MRAKLDENMPSEAVQFLRDAGWSASTVHDEQLAGASDQRLIRACHQEGRVLFTLDLDFADIRAYPPTASSGIVVLRPVRPDRDSVLALVAIALRGFSTEAVHQRLWIVEPNRIRIRGGDQESV